MPVSIHLRGPGLAVGRVARVAALVADLHHADALSAYRADTGQAPPRGELRLRDPTPGPDVVALCESLGPRRAAVRRGASRPRPPSRFDPSGLVRLARSACRRHVGRRPRSVAHRRGRRRLRGPGAQRPVAGRHRGPCGRRPCPRRVRLTDGASRPRAPRRGARTSSIRAPAARRPQCGPSPSSGRHCCGPTCSLTAAVALGADGLDLVEGLAGYEALVVTADGALATTSGLGRRGQRAVLDMSG